MTALLSWFIIMVYTLGAHERKERNMTRLSAKNIVAVKDMPRFKRASKDSTTWECVGRKYIVIMKGGVSQSREYWDDEVLPATVKKWMETHEAEFFQAHDAHSGMPIDASNEDSDIEITWIYRA